MNNRKEEKNNKMPNDMLKKFLGLKGKKVAIYGISNSTKLFLEQGREFDIVGILDGYLEEGEIYDKPIISIRKAIDLDVTDIIIIARASSTKIIYKRIEKICRENKITIYASDGRDLIKENSQQDDQEGNSLHKYFDKSVLELEEKIKLYDVISFDIFDTLIMRKLIQREDLYRLIARKAQIEEEKFVQSRIHAEKYLSTFKSPDLNEIYEYLVKKEVAYINIKKQLMTLEIEIDKKILLPRRKMVEVFEYAKDLGKRVFLTTDMYY